MQRLRSADFLRDEGAAVAPMYALALFGLITIAGVGWDYSRLMTMDSELQNAADQAALAAATQLDGKEGAMERARDAANDYLANSNSQWVNETKLANDGEGRPITSLSFQFFASYNSADDTFGTEITNDEDAENARVVRVIVNGREAFYSLTAIGGVLSSGSIEADAVAGVEGAVCNPQPMMFCVPEVDGVAQTNWPQASDIGRVVRTHPPSSAADPWAPGNFGFLDIEAFETLAQSLGGNKNHVMGLDTVNTSCFANSDISSQPGVKDPETDAFNTRFDMYGSNMKSKWCVPGAGHYCPSESVRKDQTFTETKDIVVAKGAPAPAAPACGDYDSRTGPTANSAVKSFKRDDCFFDSTPCEVFGDGVWDYASYFATRSYPTPTAADFGKADMSQVTRYDVYQWELEDKAARLAAERISSTMSGPTDVKIQGTDYDQYTFTNICAYPQPINKPAWTGGEDRRVINVAAVDCTGLSGTGNISIVGYVKFFAVEPGQGGSEKSFYLEIAGTYKPGFQTIARNKPVLLR